MRDVIEPLLLEGRVPADDGMDLVGGGEGGQKLATGRAGHLCRGERGGEVVGRVEALAPDHEDVHEVEVADEGAVVEGGAVRRRAPSSDQGAPPGTPQSVGQQPRRLDRVTPDGANRAADGVQDENLQVRQLVGRDVIERAAGRPLGHLLDLLRLGGFVWRPDRLAHKWTTPRAARYPRMHGLNWAQLRDQCLVGLSVIAFLWVASQVIGRVLHIVVVVLLALVLAYALEPALRLAQRVLPRALAALLIYALALGVLAAGILLIAPPTIQQSEALAVRLPGYLDQLSGYQPLAGIDLSGSLRGIAQSTLNSAVSVAEAVAGGVIDTMLVLVLGFWFMVDGGRMVDVALRLVPEKQRDKARFVQDTVSQVDGAYIRGQLVMAAIIGLSAGLGSWALGVRYPVLIGILAFLFELIHMVGTIFASHPIVSISHTQQFPLDVYASIFFVAMQVIENNVL